MTGALAVARYTVIELTRRRILLVFAIIGALGTLALGVGLKIVYSVAGSVAISGQQDPARFQKFLEISFLSYLYGALGIFALLIAFAIGMTAIYHDLDSGAAVSIFCKPITRAAYTAGKIGAAVATMVVIVGVLAVEARLVMLLFAGGLSSSLTGEVVAVLANTVLAMLLVLALSTWMNNIIAATVAFVYYDVVAGVIAAVHTLVHSNGFDNAIVRGIFDVLYWLVPHELVSSAPGDLVRAQLELAPRRGDGGATASQTAALIPPASGFGDIVWWAFLIALLCGLCYYMVRRRQV